jgi:phosphatidylglycerol---prolipoprotein diacylglyceryl transferase
VIPYIEQPAIQLGSFKFHAFGLLAVAAILVGIWIVVRRAPRSGLDHEKVRDVVTWTVVWGIVGSHVFSELAYFPERVAANPLILVQIWGSMSAFGGILGGLAAAVVLLRRASFTAAESWRFVDDVAFAFPFSWIFGRLGCALAHDHPGIPSTHWLAVRYPGGPRFDLGVLEFFFAAAVSVLVLVVDRLRPPTGTYVGLFFLLYGPFRLTMDFLRVDDARYFGLTPSQYVAAGVTLAGVAILVRTFRLRSDARSLAS